MSDVKSELREELKKPYAKPEIVRYGTIQALTSGATGNKSDGVALSAVSE